MSSRSELANAIRALSMDAIQKAKSGHPGAPMGMADIAEVLWNDFLKHNPNNPDWADRDRFVLSNGHGSMLIYSLLHLSGYDLSMEDIKNFASSTPKPLGTQNIETPQVWRQPPGHLAKASAMPWAWPLLKKHWLLNLIALGMKLLIITLTLFLVMAA